MSYICFVIKNAKIMKTTVSKSILDDIIRDLILIWNPFKFQNGYIRNFFNKNGYCITYTIMCHTPLVFNTSFEAFQFEIEIESDNTYERYLLLDQFKAINAIINSYSLTEVKRF